MNFSRDRYVVADRKDIVAIEIIRTVNGEHIRVTIVWLLEDGMLWRSQIHRVLIKE